MKTGFPIIASLLLLLCASISVGEKMRSSTNQDRVPKVDIVKAIELTIDHNKKNNPAMEAIFVDEAVYIRTEDTSFWKIDVRLKERETGHLYYKVNSEGIVETLSVVKDG